jgi:predicted small lipoprotein YifL
MVPRMHAVSSLSRPFLRLAVVGALAAALGLAGCGRKGPLDLPPAAAAPAGQPQATQSPPAQSGFMTPFGGPPGTSSSSGQTATASGGGGAAGVDSNGQAVAPKGPHKRIPLDVLLN